MDIQMDNVFTQTVFIENGLNEKSTNPIEFYCIQWTAMRNKVEDSIQFYTIDGYWNANLLIFMNDSKTMTLIADFLMACYMSAQADSALILCVQNIGV